MKKVLSLILALTFCFAAFSAFAPSASAADAEFTQKDAKALVDAAAVLRNDLNDYQAKYKEYLLSDAGKKIVDEVIYVDVPRHAPEAEYYPLVEELLPGSSFAAFEKLARELLVENLAERICTKANSYSLSDLIITKDGKKYILPGVTEYFYLPDRSRVELAQVSENTATANVYCVKPEYPRDISICIECKFEKTEAGWRIAESPFSDMLTGAVWSINYTYTESDIPTRELADEFSMIIRDTQYLFLQTQIYGPSGSNEVEIDGYKYSEINGTNRPSDWLEKYKKLAADTYSEDIVDLAFRFNRHDFILDRYIDNAPLFVERDGKVYWYYLAGDYVQIYASSYAVDFDKELIFDRMVIGEKEATGYVLYWSQPDGPREYCYNLRWVPVKFVKTADGWRLGDCTLFRQYYDPSSVEDGEIITVLDKDVYYRYGVDFDTYNFKDYPPSDEKFDKAKALDLLDTAYDIYLMTHEYVPTTNSRIEYVNDVPYVILDESKMYGGSFRAFEDAIDEVYAPATTVEITRSAYRYKNRMLFMETAGKTWIAYGEGLRQFFEIPQKGLQLEILEQGDNRVVGRVKVRIPYGDENRFEPFEAYVECIFENTVFGWRIGDCAYTDMLTSIEFDYTPLNNPDTGDNAFDTIALCLGGIAIIMSAICLVCRKREIL